MVIKINGCYGEQSYVQTQDDTGENTFELPQDHSVEKYREALTEIISKQSHHLICNILDYLVQVSTNKLQTGQEKRLKEVKPLINESNQFQMLHLYALFGLSEKKKKLTEFIQGNITANNLFSYLL